jgi:type IV pilus assembly protein PilC
MGLFRYEAVDKTGRVLHGAMSARDELQVSDNLAKMGYSVQAIHPADAARSAQGTGVQAPAASVAPVASATAAPVSVRSVVPLATLSSFFRQMSTLVKSGIPLYQSLSDMIPMARNKHLRSALPRMRDAIQSGQKLSGAMAAHPGVFPVWATASVWAGELAGNLDIALEEVATDLEKEASDARYGSIWWVLTKLTVVSCVFILPLCDLSKVLAPTLSPNSSNTLAEVMAVVAGIILRWTPLAIGVGLLFVAWTAVKRIPSVRSALDSMILYVPVWGKLHKYRSLARFLHVLDGLHAAGISPGTAWDAASLTARNNEIARRLRQSRQRLTGVERAADLFGASGAFESDDVGMASAGEKAGRLPEALEQLARIYDDRAAHQKSVGRMWSVSFFITSQIIVSGIATIIMTYSYFNKFTSGAGLGF